MATYSWWHRFKRSDAHTQANIVCTILVMFATISYAIIAGCQLGAMRAANVTNGVSATAASNAAKTADTTLRLSERAWIDVKNRYPFPNRKGP